MAVLVEFSARFAIFLSFSKWLILWVKVFDFGGHTMFGHDFEILGTIRPELTGEVADLYENTVFPQKNFGPDLVCEKSEQNYEEANKTLVELRGQLLKMSVWETFERNFCHFDFDIINHRRVEEPVDLFDLKGSGFLILERHFLSLIFEEI